MDIGLNLYSLRDQIKEEKSFLKTMDALKEIGISFVQYSGADFIPERIKKVSELTGLPVVLTHVAFDRITGDTDRLIAEHESFSCRNIGLGAMSQGTARNPKELEKTIASLEKAAEYMEKKGFKFFYHNHHFEFFKYEGKTIFEYITENAPHVNFTLDTYWVQYGGADIHKIIEKLNGKIECVHLKDYKIRLNEDNKFEPVFAPLGEGNMNFKTIVPEMKKAGTKYFLIEQDNATEFKHPLEQIEISVKYIKSNF
ncbi:MAG: sugar phosphate isomerase/epimerase [Clostridiales bacterium]|nr:sugar phosphate isomerase/epimerase [Clostridiales bacterium]